MNTTSHLMIRPVEPQDNPALAELVVSTLTEFGCTGPGFASSDPETQDIYHAYQAEGSLYLVIADAESQTVLGGGGFSRLKGSTPTESICELQKLYFSPKIRGLGLGKALLERLIDAARNTGYRQMYLESTPQMVGALRLYDKVGFQKIETHLGNTGHQERCSEYRLLAFDSVPLSAPPRVQ